MNTPASATSEAYPQERYAKELYEGILTTANRFLHNCVHFPMEILREENPTYKEIAELAGKIGKVVLLLADDHDRWLCQKVFEYCFLLQRIGEAIDKGDDAALAEQVEELKRKPFV